MEKRLEVINAICPGCDEERNFERADAGISLIGIYRCPECRIIRQENELRDCSYEELLREKLRGQ